MSESPSLLKEKHYFKIYLLSLDALDAGLSGLKQHFKMEGFAIVING